MQKNRDVAITVRCTYELRENAEKSAEIAGQSLVEWIRRAMQEKLNREANERGAHAEEEPLTVQRVQQMIDAAMARAGAGSSVQQTSHGDNARQSVKIGK